MAPFKIDFYSPQNQLLLNPRYNDDDRELFTKLADSFPHLKNHFWLATSGSSSNPKLVALSGKAILTSAKAVNAHLYVQSTDVWLLALPVFHVGGLGVLARAKLSDSKVENLPAWSPLEFVKLCADAKASLTALVPTQLFDLLSLDITAPKSLRACIVGGGSLSDRMYQKARSLGWPVLPSFGMTECSSQIATAPLSSIDSSSSPLPPLQVLPHVTPLVDEQGILVIESDSLLTGYAEMIKDKPLFVDPKRDGRFVTSDLASLVQRRNSTTLLPKGRVSESIKILGELVSLNKLDSILFELARSTVGVRDAGIVALPDDRSQHSLHIVAVGDPDSIRALGKSYNETVMPFERASSFHRAAELPRSSLGKLARAKLMEMVKSGKDLSLLNG